MNEYTPTNEEIREYVEAGGEPRPWVALDEAEKSREQARVAAFDRWLAAHDAAVRAAAIREAAEFIQPWNYDRPDDWTEIARALASSADALRGLAGSWTNSDVEPT